MNLIVLQFPAILISIAYALGIFINNYSLGLKSNLSFYIGLGFLFLIIVLEKYLKLKDDFKTILILTFIVLFSFLINSSRNNEFYKDDITINSEVVITKLFGSNAKYQNCIVEDLSSYKKYLVQINLKDSSKYKIGSKLFVNGILKQLSGLTIPNSFNFREYLKKRDVRHKLIIFNYIETVSELKISNNIEDKIDKSKLANSSKGLMKALVLGRKDSVPDDLLQSFSDSGVMHLLALSGLHIGILTIILTFLLRPVKLLRRGKLIRSLIVVMFLWFYAYITGFSSSIIRATIMFSIIVFGHGMRREISIFNSLAIAALVLLIINPNYLFDVGFQLSFSAVIGIIWIFPLLNKLWRPKHKVVKYFWSLLLVSISAQVATFPFTIYYFHKFSGLFFIANIIEIPLITVLLGLSYLVIVLMLFKVEFDFLIYIYDKTVIVIEWISIKISMVESMIFNHIYIDTIIVTMLFLLIISIIIFVQSGSVKYFFTFLIAILFIQIYSVYKTSETSVKLSLMIANDEIFIQDGYYYSTNCSEKSKLFSNYIMANRLKHKPITVGDLFIFDNKYYWRIGDSIDSNPIRVNHIVIVDKLIHLNPGKIMNVNTMGVIYSGYKNSNSKIRWESFCTKNDIAFYNTNENLFVR